MNLAGEWRLRGAGRDVPMALPGDGITALVAAGVLPDPYAGRNELACRWVCAETWEVSRRFDHPGGEAVLVLGEVDGIAEVRLNGATVATLANAFRRWRIPVTCRPGRNHIALTFRPVPAEAAARAAAQPFPVPWHAGNCPIPHGNMLRKQQCDFGWDWNIALAPFGLYGDLRLDPPGPRIGAVVVRQEHAPGSAKVHLEVHAESEDVTATLCAATQNARVTNGIARLTLTVENPALWWPAGQGAQTLHDLTITAGPVTETRRIGLRDIRLVSEPDAAGRSFALHVNGRPVFAKGANWIPADALAGRITQASVRDLLASATAANMNMLRVWGGGRYEPDWFYDLCDEMGLMVWQDFMFACHLYPSTPDFLAEVRAEVQETALRLHHHACLALWCGDNELIGALTWYPESRADRDRYLVSYDRLNRTVEQALKDTVPDATWWPSSPSPGPLSFGDAWHDDARGDMHMWSVWHEGRDVDHYRDVKPRFCSEFGFQSYPLMDVIRRFATPAEMNIASPVMEAHQKNAGGNARIAETMFRYFRFPATFPDFVWLSQVQQGLAIKTAVTAWRGLKPHCMGTLYWQLNDTWPCCSWSSLDHGGGWKLLHHMARHFYAPVTVVALPDAGRVRLVGVNDTAAPVALSVTAVALAMDGTRRELARGAGTVGATATDLCAVATGDLAAGEILFWDWDVRAGAVPPAAGSDHWTPVPWKALPLADPQARMDLARDGTRWRITLTAAALAPFATLEADLPGRFSDNAVLLVPGTPVTLTFTPAGEGTPAFTLRHLHSATCEA